MNMTKPSAAFPKLALWAMDTTHAKAYELLDQMKETSDEDLAPFIEYFIEHTKEHFDQERQLMLETNFPAYDEHVSEHGRIFADIIQFKAAYKRGRKQFARLFFTQSLPEILDHHIRSVDSALAAHIKKANDNKMIKQSKPAPAQHIPF
jgi:hemerythrin